MTLCGTGEALSAQDQSGLSDLQAAEKAVQRLENKLQKREYNFKRDADYEKVQATEMGACEGLRNDIWKLKDSSKALAAKLVKLAADKKASEAELAAQTGIYEARDKDIKAAEGEIASGDKQFRRLAEAGKKESDERKTKMDKLKEGLKAPADKIETLTNEKKKIDDDLKAKDAEYKTEANNLKALKERLDRLALEQKEAAAAAASAKKGAPVKEVPVIKDESPEIQKRMDDLMAAAQKLEASRKKLSDEIDAAAGEKKAREDGIKALEKEDVLKAKDLKSRSKDLANRKKAAQLKVEKLKKKEISAKFKVRDVSAQVKKLDDEIKLTAQEKSEVEKSLKTKIGELKIRISALLEHDDEDDLTDEGGKEAHPGAASRGEELSAKLDKVFGAMKEENNRLMAENKNIQVKLERAENAAKDARRKAKEAQKTPDELKAKFNKERLDAHFNLAVIYEKNSLWHDAEREYLKCLRIDPKDPGVHYNLGILYDDKLNRNNKAMYHYYKFLSLRPMGDTAERVRDWITKIELENRLGKELR
jgi:chromosome segregation ATPase